MGIRCSTGLVGLIGIIVFFGTCRLVDQDDPSDDIPVVTDPLEETFGTVRFTLQSSYTSFEGNIKDGPTPPLLIWEEVDKVGECRLYKPIVPFCADGCEKPSVCVADDSCQPYPSSVYAGALTVSGLETEEGDNSFVVDTIRSFYQMVGVNLVFPPADEGDVITVSAAGSEAVPAFSMSLKAIKPLVMLNDSIVCGEGQNIELIWEAASDPSQSEIHYLVDVSHHGGTKGKIEGTCPDNGAYTIPATLLDQLKSYGVFGFPVVKITRRSSGVDTLTKTQALMESKVELFFTIPGFYSCQEDSDCPNGMTCAESGFICE